MSNIEKIRAIAAENSKDAPHAVSAAIDRQLKSLTRVLAQAGVEVGYGKISAIELSRKLKAAGYSAEKRIETKVALERAGLLSE